MGQTLMKVFVVILAALLSAQPGRCTLNNPLVLTGVTIIDATGGPAQPDMTVVIVDGRVSQIGKRSQTAVPDSAQVVNASGKFMIPGLWDMHVHWYDEASLGLFTANGVSGVRIMCGFPLHLRWRQDLAKATLLGPRLILAGPIVDGPRPVWPDSIRAATDAEGRQAAQTIKKLGYDCIKIYNLLPRDAYYGVAAAARQLDLPLVGHVPFAISAGEASDAGQRSIEHLSAVALACSTREPELRKQLGLAYSDDGDPATALLLRFEVEAEDSYDGQKAAALFARLAANHTWVVPTLTVREAHALLRDQPDPADVRWRYLPPSLRSRWGTRRAATFKRLRPEDFANYRRSFQKQLELTAALHRAGVPLLAGTDTGALDCFPGFGVHRELELLVKAGLTPLEALQSATRNAAEYLGKQEELGTIQRGKLADLVLLDANPLDDIRNTTRIHAVVVNGRLLQRADLQLMLDQIEISCRQRSADKPPGAHRKYP